MSLLVVAACVSVVMPPSLQDQGTRPETPSYISEWLSRMCNADAAEPRAEYRDREATEGASLALREGVRLNLATGECPDGEQLGGPDPIVEEKNPLPPWTGSGTERGCCRFSVSVCRNRIDGAEPLVVADSAVVSDLRCGHTWGRSVFPGLSATAGTAKAWHGFHQPGPRMCHTPRHSEATPCKAAV